MLTPEQIPDAAVTAAWNASSMLDAIAAAINAWPRSYSLSENDSATIREMACFILPFTENTND